MARSSVMLPRGGANDFDSDAQPETAPSDAQRARGNGGQRHRQDPAAGAGAGCCGTDQRSWGEAPGDLYLYI